MKSQQAKTQPENDQATPHDPFYKDFFSYPESVESLLKEKFSFDQISRATGFSVPDIERLAAEHRQN